MYVITRRDLTPGQQATQAVHAAFDFAISYPEISAKWRDESHFLVVLAAADQAELLHHTSLAWDRGLRYSLFTEPDMPVGEQITALVIEPGTETSRLCSNLPLCLKQEAAV